MPEGRRNRTLKENGESPRNPRSRTTIEGWRKWTAARKAAKEAKELTLDESRSLSTGLRIAACANLPKVDTPMSLALTEEIEPRLITNSLNDDMEARPGIMTTGGGFQGKTETICTILANFEEFRVRHFEGINPRSPAGARDEHIPVVYVQTPAVPTPKRLCARILDFFGADYHGMGEDEMTMLLSDSLEDHDVCALAIDDITRLRLYRLNDEHCLNLLRQFMDMGVTLLLVGVDIPGSKISAALGAPSSRDSASRFGDDLATQLDRRCKLLHLKPFRRSTPKEIEAWSAHLKGIEDYLPLLKSRPGMLTSGTMPEYLFRRTNGVIGLLNALIKESAFKAITTGKENLTQELLDTCVIDISNDDTRVAAAGEFPPVPPTPGSHPTKKKLIKRSRNATLDDDGIPESEQV